MKARHVQNIASHESPGDFSFPNPHADGTQSLLFSCPGCGELHGITVLRGANHVGPVWEWNGDREHPDVNPSIRVEGGPKNCTWHGWLRNGVWVNA